MARIVIVGGDAAGMSAASQARRLLGDDHEVIALERGQHTSYAACGIPYWIAGRIGSADDLVARTPQEHRERGIDLRTGVEVTAIDRAARSVRAGGEHIGYDHLLLATGAEPVQPDLPGMDLAGIETVMTLDDGARVREDLGRHPRHAVIVGSGYIGVELAEACLARGLATTVVDVLDQPLGLLVPELGAKVAEAMTDAGVRFLGGREVTGFRGEARVSGVELDDGTVLAADLVVLGLGVTARSRLAADAGLELGPGGAVVVDEHQRAAGRIWAAGDCAAVRDRQTGHLLHVPLGDTANRQGLVAGHAIAAAVLGTRPRWSFDGVVQTAITKFVDLEIARTGLSPEQADAAGLDTVTATVDTTTRAGYYPGAEPMTVWLMADRADGRLLGAQIVGAAGAGLRIDVAATAITARLAVDDLVMLDLAYAPPFGSVWHPLQVAARRICDELAIS